MFGGVLEGVWGHLGGVWEAFVVVFWDVFGRVKQRGTCKEKNVFIKLIILLV